MTTCGISTIIGPLPSDPSQLTGISAQSVYGGIRLVWGYPATNAHAVAYVRVFRAIQGGTIDQLASAKGNSYIDTMSEAQAGTVYEYYAQAVSVNGTVFARVGPATAQAESPRQQTVAQISGAIDASALAVALRSKIEDIPSLRTDLINEQTGRLAAIDALVLQLSALGVDVTQTTAAVIAEQTTRISGQNILAQQISGVVASNGTNLAAILAEETARVSATDALSQSITTIAARTSTAEAAITQEQTTRAGADSAQATQINTLTTNVGNAFTAIQNLDTSLNDGSHALAQKASTLEADITELNDDNDPQSISARVQDKLTAQIGYCVIGRQVDGNGVVTDYGTPTTNTQLTNRAACQAAGHHWLELRQIGEVLQGVQVDDGDGAAKVEQLMTAYRDELGDLNARYTLKIENGLITGGFGIDANAQTQNVSAIFDVDQFSIGKLGTNAIKPFIVENGVVYIHEAEIKNLSVDSIKIKNQSMSVTSNVQYTLPYYYREEHSSGGVTYPEGWRSHKEILQIRKPPIALIIIPTDTGATTLRAIVEYNFYWESLKVDDDHPGQPLQIQIEYIIRRASDQKWLYANSIDSFTRHDNDHTNYPWGRLTTAVFRHDGATGNVNGSTFHCKESINVLNIDQLLVRISHQGIGPWLPTLGPVADVSSDYEHMRIDNVNFSATVLIK